MSQPLISIFHLLASCFQFNFLNLNFRTLILPHQLIYFFDWKDLTFFLRKFISFVLYYWSLVFILFSYHFHFSYWYFDQHIQILIKVWIQNVFFDHLIPICFCKFLKTDSQFIGDLPSLSAASSYPVKLPLEKLVFCELATSHMALSCYRLWVGWMSWSMIIENFCCSWNCFSSRSHFFFNLNYWTLYFLVLVCFLNLLYIFFVVLAFLNFLKILLIWFWSNY